MFKSDNSPVIFLTFFYLQVLEWLEPYFYLLHLPRLPHHDVFLPLGLAYASAWIVSLFLFGYFFSASTLGYPEYRGTVGFWIAPMAVFLLPLPVIPLLMWLESR